ncbi:hypothetical protein CHU92_10775 [Flavobacterium cyanobacteriorum]|uniref:Secretion system C-terminal sorting domain-containing protein n=1 Tax=Flavobacterium cyanobacteriorum TaxID=2022802 RepID=A0A255Z3E6_9FLAO|nr:T9SS type A sorting domain-containing protein [Flavobacterium cyanobacteriorum]OYQ35454.1 hypothetical protein CHU92_10775 [Flavobacterium cyanobacteriorum]
MVQKLLLLLLALGWCSMWSQDILWEKSYGGRHADYLFDAQPSADYGFILAGSSLSNAGGNKTEGNMGNLDYWIWKMNEAGELDWQKNLGGTGQDLLHCIRTTRDGGFILAGTSDSPSGLHKKDSCRGGTDLWIVKLDAKGGEQWQRTIGGSGQELLRGIVQTTDGGYIIGASSASDVSPEILKGRQDPYGKWESSRGGLDFWIIKLDKNGDIKWQRTLGGLYADVLESIEQTADGGYIIGGHSNSPASPDKPDNGYGSGDYWILKLDQDGAVAWQRDFGGDEDDHLYALKQVADGGYIAGGSSASPANGSKKKSNRKGTDMWVLRLDDKGELLWEETYHVGEADLLTAIVANRDGSFLLGGYTRSESAAAAQADRKEINDYITLKINAKGEEQWRRAIGSSGEDILRKMIETRDGGYLLAGTSKGQVSRDRNSGKGSNDFWIVKLKDNDKEKTGEKRDMLEAAPNPAEQFTNIIVGYEFLSGTATVYDLAGRQLQAFPVTDRTIPVDLGGYPQGIYIVEVRTNAGTDSVKVVKSKR